jgi:hypothetical protein
VFEAACWFGRQLPIFSEIKTKCPSAGGDKTTRKADQRFIARLGKTAHDRRTMDVGSFLRGLPGGQALNSAKDQLLAKGAKTHCNKLIEPYGSLLDLQLNTAARSISATLQLKGEQTPIDIHVHEYTLSAAEGKSVLLLDGSKIDTSREWLTALIRDKVNQKELVVPDNLEWVVQLLR